MQSIRENKKNGNGENLFSPVPFFVFGWPVDYFNRILKFLFSQVSCGNNRIFPPKSFRKPESRGGTPLAQGYGGRGGPCPVLNQHKSCFLDAPIPPWYNNKTWNTEQREAFLYG